MTEENNIDKDNHKPETNDQKIPKDIILTITLSGKTGRIESVQGPGNGTFFDEPLCDWLMKKASRYIESHNIKQQQSSIIFPRQQPRIRDIFRKH